MTKTGNLGKGLTLIILTGLLADSAFAGMARTWTDVTGAKIEAEYVSSTDKKVTLRKANLQNLTVPLNKLSEEDQKFVADLQKEEKEANIIKLKFKGDIVWRLDNQYRMMSLMTEQTAELWTWDEETKSKGKKITSVKVNYNYEFSGARNDVEGYFETDEAVEVPKGGKLVVVSKLSMRKDNRPLDKEDVSIPMPIPMEETNDVIKLPTARATARN